MQQCLGPCGREVEQTNASGLCARCQQERARENGASSAAGLAPNTQVAPTVVADPGVIKRRGPYKKKALASGDPMTVDLCGRGCGKPRHRGNCKGTTNRTRAAKRVTLEPKENFGRPPARDMRPPSMRREQEQAASGEAGAKLSERGVIEELRAETVAALDLATQEYARLTVELASIDKILARLELYHS